MIYKIKDVSLEVICKIKEFEELVYGRFSQFEKIDRKDQDNYLKISKEKIEIKIGNQKKELNGVVLQTDLYTVINNVLSFIIDDEMRALARNIVGNEADPLRQASLVYDWIDAYFPWAGAREYSTIGNLARYVLDRGYGDCGQVSSLYITLLRALGIPARWESGWMLHPGKEGMHDWAEVYYEGIGWVPVDMSFGILEVANDKAVRNFYKTGIDIYRFASNKGVGGKLSPEKKFVRSETVDFQLGEMEYDDGNLFYYRDWTPDFELISIEEIK